MNKIIIASSVLSIIFTIVFLIIFLAAPKGSGKLIEEIKEIEAFNAVSINIFGNITIEKGSKYSAKIKTDDNVLPKVSLTVQNKILTIILDKRFMNITNMEITLTTPELIGIGTTEPAIVTMKDFYSNDNFYIIIEGKSEIYAKVNTINATTRFKGEGTIFIEGTAETHDIVLEGSPSLSGFNFITQTTKVESNTSGFCNITAMKNLEAKIKAEAHIVYAGNPEVKSEITGTGKLIKRIK